MPPDIYQLMCDVRDSLKKGQNVLRFSESSARSPKSAKIRFAIRKKKWNASEKSKTFETDLQ
jgi:hypothetical protein